MKLPQILLPSSLFLSNDAGFTGGIMNSLITISLTVFLSLLGTSESFAHNPIWNTPLKSNRITATTPLYENQQNYLEASPAGVGARAAWTLPGGTGELVKIVDIETCYETNHEDFNTPF